MLIADRVAVEDRAGCGSISVVTRTPGRLEQLDVGDAADLHAAVADRRARRDARGARKADVDRVRPRPQAGAGRRTAPPGTR